VVAFLATLFDWIENHQGLAAWMQAVGTVAALFIAIGVTERQHKLSERARREEAHRQRDDQLLSVVIVASYAADLIKDAATFFRTEEGAKRYFERTYDPHIFQNADRALDQIPLYVIGNGMIIEYLMLLRALLNETKGVIDEAKSRFPDKGLRIFAERIPDEKAATAIGGVKQALDDWRNRQEGRPHQ
jgi:hypothetical protein